MQLVRRLARLRGDPVVVVEPEGGVDPLREIGDDRRVVEEAPVGLVPLQVAAEAVAARSRMLVEGLVQTCQVLGSEDAPQPQCCSVLAVINFCIE